VIELLLYQRCMHYYFFQPFPAFNKPQIGGRAFLVLPETRADDVQPIG
jgi:hypothetical protein